MKAIIAALSIAAQMWGAEGRDFQGTIVEQHSGNPVRYADIRVKPSGGANRAATLSKSGEDGRFSATAIDADSYTIEITKPNYAPTRLTVFARSIPSFVVSLVRLGTIRGRITRSDGASVVTGSVFAIPKTGQVAKSLEPGGRFTSNLDSDGTFRLHNLPLGEYRIVARAQNPLGGTLFSSYPDRRRPQPIILNGDGEERQLNIVLEPNSRFVLRGTIPNSQAGQHFSVALVSEAVPEVAVAFTTTDEKGAFAFTNVNADRYVLHAGGPIHGTTGSGALLGKTRLFGSTPVDLASGDVSGQSITLEPGRSLTLVLQMVERQSQSRCPGTIEAAVSSAIDWGVTLGSNVSVSMNEPFTFVGMPPGKYDLITNADGECVQHPTTSTDMISTDVTAPAVVTFSGPGTLSGRVVGTDRFNGLQILARPVVQRGDAQDLFTTILDSEGNFMFPQLRVGKYLVAATMRDLRLGGQQGERLIEVLPAEPVHVELSVKPSDLAR